MGIPSEQPHITPEIMGATREKEAVAMANALGISLTILKFPDMGLPFISLEVLIHHTLPIIRELHTKALFSFHPYEMTPYFDHPDHNIAGQVAKHIGAAADVKHFMPDGQVVSNRPDLYFWTSKSKNANRYIPLSARLRLLRDQHLATYHQSQFKLKDRPVWRPIFDQITRISGKTHRELYEYIPR